MSLKKGFTLLEVLLVVAILGVLAGIVIVAINPSKQLGETNDAVRRADINSILNAVSQYALDNAGILPDDIDTLYTSAQVLGTQTSGCNSTCTATTTQTVCVDLSQELVPEYLTQIPFDPATGNSANTDYYINRNAQGRVEVGACDPQQASAIEFKR